MQTRGTIAAIQNGCARRRFELGTRARHRVQRTGVRPVRACLPRTRARLDPRCQPARGRSGTAGRAARQLGPAHPGTPQSTAQPLPAAPCRSRTIPRSSASIPAAVNAVLQILHRGRSGRECERTHFGDPEQKTPTMASARAGRQCDHLPPDAKSEEREAPRIQRLAGGLERSSRARPAGSRRCCYKSAMEACGQEETAGAGPSLRARRDQGAKRQGAPEGGPSSLPLLDEAPKTCSMTDRTHLDDNSPSRLISMTILRAA